MAATSFYKGTIPILDDFGFKRTDLTHPKGVRYGMVPRDYALEPETMMAGPDDMETIDPSEWDARYDEEEATESSLEHIFLRGGKPAFVNLDQDGDGHCWAYSTMQAKMLANLRDLVDPGLVRRMNPHFIASYLQRWNGGWCGASAKVLAEVGCAEEGTGPDQWRLHLNDASRAKSPAILAAAALHRSTEEWRDLTRQIWDNEMTARQLATQGFNKNPSPSDFNWWGHSVCQVRWVRIEKGSWGPLILNSWKGWGRFGLGVLRGSRATADGAVCVRQARFGGKTLAA